MEKMKFLTVATSLKILSRASSAIKETIAYYQSTVSAEAQAIKTS